MSKIPSIKQVIYSDPVTVIIWGDGTKTISRCDDDDIYDELTGFMLCVFKKALTPKTMRKMFNQYVYDVNSENIKWQSSPTWLEECWADEFICNLNMSNESAAKCLRDAFKVGESHNTKTEAVYKGVLDDNKIISDLADYMLDNIDKEYLCILKKYH